MIRSFRSFSTRSSKALVVFLAFLLAGVAVPTASHAMPPPAATSVCVIFPSVCVPTTNPEINDFVVPDTTVPPGDQTIDIPTTWDGKDIPDDSQCQILKVEPNTQGTLIDSGFFLFRLKQKVVQVHYGATDLASPETITFRLSCDPGTGTPVTKDDPGTFTRDTNPGPGPGPCDPNTDPTCTNGGDTSTNPVVTITSFTATGQTNLPNTGDINTTSDTTFQIGVTPPTSVTTCSITKKAGPGTLNPSIGVAVAPTETAKTLDIHFDSGELTDKPNDTMNQVTFTLSCTATKPDGSAPSTASLDSTVEFIRQAIGQPIIELTPGGEEDFCSNE